MKALRTTPIIVAAVLVLTAVASSAQDRIITVTGSTIKGNVKRIGDRGVTYRRLFRQHEIKTKKVLYIEYHDGTQKEVNDISTAKHYKDFSQLSKNNPMPDSIKKMSQGFTPMRIERIGNSFRIDGKRLVNTKELNKIVSQSPNPMVKMNLKAAKTMRTFGIISKISSYPGSAAGAFATFKTCQTMFEQLKQGPAPFKTYLGVGLSFVGTLTLPITNKILKHFQDKLYDKTLLTYSVGS